MRIAIGADLLELADDAGGWVAYLHEGPTSEEAEEVEEAAEEAEEAEGEEGDEGK